MYSLVRKCGFSKAQKLAPMYISARCDGQASGQSLIMDSGRRLGQTTPNGASLEGHASGTLRESSRPREAVIGRNGP